MTEDDYLPLSGIHQFAVCRRRWALIEIERQWVENVLTADGRILHERAHDDALREKRGDLLILRGLKVSSRELGLSGVCDVVEFYACEDGIPLHGRKGTWLPCPVEYKRGKPQENDCDRLQLCAQGMCLEEMLACEIPQGVLFYYESRRRETVSFTEDLRRQTRAMAAEMQELFRRRYTPKVKPGAFCKRCSLQEICLPALCRHTRSVAQYLQQHMEDSA